MHKLCLITLVVQLDRFSIHNAEDCDLIQQQFLKEISTLVDNLIVFDCHCSSRSILFRFKPSQVHHLQHWYIVLDTFQHHIKLVSCIHVNTYITINCTNVDDVSLFVKSQNILTKLQKHWKGTWQRISTTYFNFHGLIIRRRWIYHDWHMSTWLAQASSL